MSLPQFDPGALIGQPAETGVQLVCIASRLGLVSRRRNGSRRAPRLAATPGAA